MIKIAPSLLASDFSKLKDEIKKVENAGADLIHIDVMDGHFVPNITIGPPVIKCLRNITKLPLDVHLMIENPDNYIGCFADAGAEIITVHTEACTHLNRVIQRIRSRNITPSVSLNPSTSLSSLEWILNDVDMVLIMTVNPGFGGQSFIDSTIEKINKLYGLVKEKELNIDIEVDGGINIDNIHKVAQAGANVIVSGSTIFKAENTYEIINSLREKAYKGWYLK